MASLLISSLSIQYRNSEMYSAVIVLRRASLAVETKVLLFCWLAHLNNRKNICKQISFAYVGDK